MLQHNYKDLIKLFNDLFKSTENTLLVAGGDEPLYLPQDETHSANRIIFTKDYYSSALHEIAHWCIAGKKRRQLRDYGYWYNPHRHTVEDQQLFEQMEAKPQALEWIFSVAAGIRFNISADNLAMNNEVSETFKKAITEQAINYHTHGLPKNAELFTNSLLHFYQRKDSFNSFLFSFVDL